MMIFVIDSFSIWVSKASDIESKYYMGHFNLSIAFYQNFVFWSDLFDQQFVIRFTVAAVRKRLRI